MIKCCEACIFSKEEIEELNGEACFYLRCSLQGLQVFSYKYCDKFQSMYKEEAEDD